MIPLIFSLNTNMKAEPGKQERDMAGNGKLVVKEQSEAQVFHQYLKERALQIVLDKTQQMLST